MSSKDPSFDSAREAACAIPAPTYDLLGVAMSVLTIPDAVQRILEAVDKGQSGYVCVTGMHGVMEARDDASLQGILNKAFLCTPDGMPTVWLGKARGHSMDRVYGPDLTLALLQATQNTSVRHFFYGGADGVADDLKNKMERRFPGIKIVGTYCPPFRPLTGNEIGQLKSQIEICQPDLLWVGLSTPKQERFMAKFLPLLPVKVMLGVGAAFDFHTGRAKQAPRWMMRAGLEWFFRLITEPRRLWRRYVIQVPRFALLVILDALGLVSHSSAAPEIPPAFRLAGTGYRVLPFLALLWLAGAVILAFSARLGVAFAVAAANLVPLVAAGASFLFLHFQSEEDRLDRFVPMASVLLFFWCLFLSFGVNILTPLASLAGWTNRALDIARFAALASGTPSLLFFAGLILCAVCGAFLSNSSPRGGAAFRNGD